jgi:hypothetical protein
MQWLAPSVDNPWGDRENDAAGCLLRFFNVATLSLYEGSHSDGEDCVVGISKVKGPPAVCPWKYRVSNHFLGEDNFGLIFELENGRVIEIHADFAELSVTGK